MAKRVLYHHSVKQGQCDSDLRALLKLFDRWAAQLLA